MVIGVLAGTFDPITNGHLDIILRSLKFVDKLIILIGINPKKETLFSLNKRKSFISETLFEVTSRYTDITIDSYDGLTVNYAQEHGASLLIRGVRTITDFEYENNLASGNKLLAPTIETVYIPCKPELAVVSSSMVKEIHRWKGNVSGLVPSRVNQALLELYQNESLTNL